MSLVQFATHRWSATLGAGLTVLALSACGSTGGAGGSGAVTGSTVAQAAPPPTPLAQPSRTTPRPPPPRFVATPGLSQRDRVRRAIELLMRGQAEAARPELIAYLTEKPDGELPRKLVEQIDQDPKTVLGPNSFPYVVKTGETLPNLAERFLGDRFLFWALARYNSIADPSTLTAGQTVQIPGTRRQPQRIQVVETDDELIDRRLEGRPPPRPVQRPPATATTAAPPVAAGPARDPARAQQLRGSALEQLGRGAVAQAVALLEQALRLDPGNSLITRDLERARRLLPVRR